MLQLQTIEMDRDTFAKFMFYKGLKTKNYNFDIVIDLKKIHASTRPFNGMPTNEPFNKVMYFYYKRNNGSWLGSEQSETSAENSDEHYKFTFTLNCDYLQGVQFAKVTKLN